MILKLKKKTDRKRSSWEAMNVRSSTLLYVLCDHPIFLLYSILFEI
jgi:hypothetical protein